MNNEKTRANMAKMKSRDQRVQLFRATAAAIMAAIARNTDAKPNIPAAVNASGDESQVSSGGEREAC